MAQGRKGKLNYRCPRCLMREIDMDMLYDRDRDEYYCLRCQYTGTEEDVKALAALGVDELMQIREVGPGVAESVHGFFRDDANRALVEDLLAEAHRELDKQRAAEVAAARANIAGYARRTPLWRPGLRHRDSSGSGPENRWRRGSRSSPPTCRATATCCSTGARASSSRRPTRAPGRAR